MDTLKSFENLSDSDKIVFFQTLLSSTEGQSDTQEETPDMCNSEKSNFTLFLEGLKKRYENIPKYNLQVEKSKSKQRTLDSWLIKRKNVSVPKSKEGEGQSVTLSCETLHTCNESEVNLHFKPVAQNNCIDIGSVDSVPRERKSVEGRIINKESDMNKNVSEEKDPINSFRTTENSETSNEKYNLRRKRKASEQPTISKGGKRGVKCLKPTGIQKEGPNITDCDNVSNQVNNIDDSNQRPSIKENDKCDKSSSDGSEKYNLRTKKKSPVLSQPIEAINITDRGESNNQIDQTLTKSKEPLSNTTSPSHSSYEAFSLLTKKCQEIGINIIDILKNENIQTLLNDHKNVSGDAVVFVGSFKTKAEKIMPVVHLAQSKTVLLKTLYEVKK